MEIKPNQKSTKQKTTHRENKNKTTKKPPNLLFHKGDRGGLLEKSLLFIQVSSIILS